MKVLFVLQSLQKAGAERLVVNICNEIVNCKGCSVAIYLMRNVNEFDKEIDKNVIICGGDGVIRFSFFKPNTILNDGLIRFIDKYKPDIIHSHLHHADLFSHSFFYEKASYVSHIHNSIIKEYNGFLLKEMLNKTMWANYYEYRWIMKRFKKFQTNFIACSNGAKELHAKKIKIGNIITLQNASPINNSFFDSKKLNDTLKLIWVGRLSNVKRPQLAIRVAYVLKLSGLKFHLTIVGNGNEMSNCIELLDQLSLQDVVTMLGSVDCVDLLLKEAHLLLHTASYEGLPMVFMEANSWCVPIICTDCMPKNEFIEDGKNGIVVKSDDPELLANEIIRICNTPNKYVQMSRDSFLIAKKFDVKNYVEALLKFYNNISK